jgi:putative spermidine/putrescine transport system substrate-binding protein
MLTRILLNLLEIAMNKRILLLLVMVMLIVSCGSQEEKKDWLHQDFATITQAARNTEVRWYMYGGWSHVNSWVDTWVSKELASRYGIRLVRVPMDASVFVNKLLAEKAAGKKTGVIDLLWINGENFKNAKEAGLLTGPFTQLLPHFTSLFDPQAAAHDFGYPVDGYEAPWGRAQFVLEYDTARTPEPPRTLDELKTWIKAHPGRFTYPQPPDFTGSAFVRQVFYAVTGGAQQYMSGFDQALFDARVPALWDWLNEIKPYLWQQGTTYPKDSGILDTLFARGEVDMSMSYHPSHAQTKILESAYPATVRTFVLKDGSVANTHFLAIPFNAPNVPGALVVANFLLSVDAQVAKYRPDNWGDFPALDMNRLSARDRDRFDRVDLGPATLSAGYLADYAVSEIPSAYLEAIEKGWNEHVLGNTGQ